MKKLYSLMLVLHFVIFAFSQESWQNSTSKENNSSPVFFTNISKTGTPGDAGRNLKPINSGKSWITLPSGTGSGLASVYFTDSNTGYAGGGSGTLLKTSDAGTSWMALSSGTTSGIKSIFFLNSETGYTAGIVPYYSGFVYKTVDAGTTWTVKLGEGVYNFMLSSIFFTDANNGYAVGGDYKSGAICKTTDGGTTWTHQYVSNQLNSVCFTSLNTGYIVGAMHTLGGIILKTDDAGATWSEQFPPEGLNSIFFINASIGYAVGYNGSIVKTTNGGTNWVVLSNKISNDLSSVFFVDENTGYAVGLDGIIIKTINGGATWNVLSSGTTKNLYSVFFTDANTGYVVGAGGIILKTTNGGGMVVTPDNFNVASSAGIVHFSVTSDTSWTVSSDSSWCSITPSGSGNDTITVNYAENNSFSTRVAKINVYSAKFDSISVTITQAGQQFSVTPSDTLVPAEHGSVNFSVISPDEWVASSDESWCTVTPSGTAGKGMLVADYLENTLAFPRVAHILVTAQGLHLPGQTVTLRQAPSSFGIKDIAENDFRIWPNPANRFFRIVPGRMMKGPFVLTVRDLQGQVILRRPIKSDKENEIDLSTTTSGSYFIIVESDDRVYVRKLVIIR
jgi:photosystem II stability/assembly factor-like uncharacterized protein